MKSHRWIWLSVPLFLACIAVVIDSWHHRHLVYPTPETESAFLKSYTPEHVIDRFREVSQSFSHTRHSGGGAGRTFVTHQAGFDFYVVLRREKWMPLMNSLRDNVLQQLANNGAEVLSQSGGPREGFHFDYKFNRSIGSLTISPLVITPP